ncbi:hypothetical protein ABMA27_016747 [Loxostege sticticalis]|uniref:Cyclic nucleotide-binding domain-containing protein n=1 Tax=Loxostege sticticalis TaxID=481309 RepID=A0ABR3I3G4_LOXSC
MYENPDEKILDYTIIPDEYFQGHKCQLPPEKLSPFHILSTWQKFIFDLTTVRSNDIRARIMFKSYAALCAEKYRQHTFYPFSIHPYSKLRLWLEVVFVFANLISFSMIPLHFSDSPHNINLEPDYHLYVIYVTDVLVGINIVANFLTGYIDGYTYQYVVLDLKKICFKYITTWFVVDFLKTISCLPAMIQAVIPHAIVVSFEILRLPILFFYLSNVMQAFKVGILTKTCIEVFVYAFSYITWNIYFQFALEYIIEGTYSPENPRPCSWLTMGKLWNATASVRFVYAMERAVSMLRKNSNLNLITNEGCYETFYTFAWVIAKLMVYHCGLKYIIAAYGRESAEAKYFTMTRQIEMYMDQRKLPPRIKKKILKFYAIRYQASFFVEAHILACVSGLLREDILMHTGRQLVRELEFLKQLPRTLLLQIGLQLKLAIFIAGDIIYKINTIGDCLYFIHKGTVAIYSESGKEVCHLEDGDFFGEIALVMKDRFRTVNVVAVTNCELFRLSREDFNSSIACYPTVYEHFKKVGIQRHEITCVLDETHKTAMRNSIF